jgi:exopolyphosphatase / guanosine-5'-triphosphate,3'-diphosphate pyrophosphatase
VARTAVVDLGTNTTRLLVADVEGGIVHPLARRSEVTRLGEGVDSSGHLGEAAMHRVLATVADYCRTIDAHGAEVRVAVATSAVRDAANRDELLDRLREELGLDARTLSGDDEARLTFLGATHARPPGEPVLVLDIGGGSTEFVIGVPRSDPTFHVSTDAGSVRQTERHLRDDPPPPDEVADVADEVRGIVAAAVPQELRRGVGQGIAVAGTATTLAAIDQEIDYRDPHSLDSYELELGACERMLALLAELPLERRRRVTGLHPDRAPTIVAGAVILVEAMRAFGLAAMQTSEADILQGAALTANGANSGR